MQLLLEQILHFTISLAAHGTMGAIDESRRKALEEQLNHQDRLRKALNSEYSLREELRGACLELARNRDRLGISAAERPLWLLLTDESFQSDFLEWLMAGGIEEGNAAKARLLSKMESALLQGDTAAESISFLRSRYLETLEKAVFGNPVLSAWRHQLSLDYLRQQVVALRKRVEEAAGLYTADQQKAALDRYCEKSLAEWDIIDLSGLPEEDIHIATQKLLLRQLYVPLRFSSHRDNRDTQGDAFLNKLEDSRSLRRRREAGHITPRDSEEQGATRARSSIGEKMGKFRHMVILGDPGGGKTTMLRWLATACLLQQSGDSAFAHLPDTETLLAVHLIPVLIRCRDLGEADLCRSFTDFLTQHLNKSELLPEEAKVMRAVILQRIALGRALLLVDGLDEITNPHVRAMLCQELERTAARYPDAPIIVTSRMVGYRNMPYRMGKQFHHAIIAELDHSDKDLFANRWVEITEQHHKNAEKAKRLEELLSALHSSDRIERLTGNPMLLTTLALVKRKVGRLPSRRAKLYREAVSVLLNWNPRLYSIIEEDEAIPQLEYLAYEMCRRGVQRLTEDEVIGLLETLRSEYPNVHAIRRRDPPHFLSLLEARSSILIRSGEDWSKSPHIGKRVWEFRHLTFQEYLAARALLEGRYPGRDRTEKLVDLVAGLSAPVKGTGEKGDVEFEIAESWREVLPLLVSDANDDDVDGLIESIATAQSREKATAKPRLVMAARCLADEPNASEETAMTILAKLASLTSQTESSMGLTDTTFGRVALELAGSLWGPKWRNSLLGEFQQRKCDDRKSVVMFLAKCELTRAPVGEAFETWSETLASKLDPRDEKEAIAASLAVMHAGLANRLVLTLQVAVKLLGLLGGSPALSHAAAWALSSLNCGFLAGRAPDPAWRPTDQDVLRLIQALNGTPPSEAHTLVCLLSTLAASQCSKAAHAVIDRMTDANEVVRRGAIEAFVRAEPETGIDRVVTLLEHPGISIRYDAIELLGRLRDSQSLLLTVPRVASLDADTRRAAVEVLRRRRDLASLSGLAMMLQHPSAFVRRATCEALGALRKNSIALDLLVRRLVDPVLDVRLAALRELVCTVSEVERILLSKRLDGLEPWIDPQDTIPLSRLADTCRTLGTSEETARAHYAKLAARFGIRLGWEPT
jgi:hypothetical protein